MENVDKIVLNLNIEPYTNILIPMDDISPEAMEEIDTKIELAKQIAKKHASYSKTEVTEEKQTNSTAPFAQTAGPVSQPAGTELKVNFGDEHNIQVSKFVKVDDSGQYSYYIYEVIEDGALKTLRASLKLHEALTLVSPEEVIVLSKVKKTNAKGREYQTYQVIKADGTKIL